MWATRGSSVLAISLQPSGGREPAARPPTLQGTDSWIGRGWETSERQAAGGDGAGTRERTAVGARRRRERPLERGARPVPLVQPGRGHVIDLPRLRRRTALMSWRDAARPAEFLQQIVCCFRFQHLQSLVSPDLEQNCQRRDWLNIFFCCVILGCEKRRGSSRSAAYLGIEYGMGLESRVLFGDEIVHGLRLRGCIIRQEVWYREFKVRRWGLEDFLAGRLNLLDRGWEEHIQAVPRL
ncbi:uncharacterized protein LOC127577714 [Pristis pectinata]|uniref:uncharacterized protein LOC127577714 n=1 Tax=Pristis pectinata TaxID=685728 RepID=UPI00223D599D|nr:uncharacterized protein LOC127577714 [Pristis pectinata]